MKERQIMRGAFSLYLRSRSPTGRTLLRSLSSKCCHSKAESSPLPSTSTSYSCTAHGRITNRRKHQRNFSTVPVGVSPFRVYTTCAPIDSRIKSTMVSNIRTLSSLSPDEKEYIDALRRKTRDWLQITVGTWTQREVSKGRFLIREWSDSYDGSNNRYDIEEHALQQTKILRRWIKERKAELESNRLQSIFHSQSKEKKNSTDGGNKSDSQEMVEMLNRCLDSWRKVATVQLSPTITTKGTTSTTRNKSNPQVESMGLIRLFCDTSEYLNDTDLLPNQKTYSMCMNVLSLHPGSFSACDDVLSLLNQCRNTAKPDLQFYSVCLHTLAKCATYHREAPILVEQIFQEMTNTSDFSPNTACFVSVLHAWSNSIPANGSKGQPHHGAPEEDISIRSLAAERAETILNQMIREYPQLVNTICFNVCIDAWGKQGYPEKAEAMLHRLHNYQRRSDSAQKDIASLRKEIAVLPNQISYNSAINAWSKSASFGGKGDKDPLKAADRAARLFQLMKGQGLEPTPETFGSLMEAYSKTPNPGIRVQSFLDELEKLYSEGEISHPPPKVCYLMAIRAWGRTTPGGAKRADSIVQRLEELCSQDNVDWAELKPCTILYTALISAWAQSGVDGAPDRAHEIFQEMVRKSKMGRSNVYPNVITLNALLEVFCNHGRIDEALEFLTKTKRVVPPDSKSYLTILKAYANSKAPDAAEKAQEFYSELVNDYHHGESATKPTVRMYSQLLVAWGNSPKHDGAFRAEELFWKLLRKDDDDGIGIMPDTATVNCVLRAWSKSSEGGAAERAEAFLRKVRDEHSEISINPISHLHLIYAWAHSRRRKAPREAEKHLDHARALCRSGNHPGWKLTRAHFNGTILAWKKSDDRNAAHHIQKLQEERDSTT